MAFLHSFVSIVARSLSGTDRLSEVNKMAEKNPFFRKLDDAINRYREETGKEPGYITMSVMMFGLFCREADPYLTKDVTDRIPPEGNFYSGIPIHVDLRQRNDCISVHGCEKAEKELKPCPFCGRTESVRIRIYPSSWKYTEDQYAIVCDHNRGGCGSESGHYSDPEKATKYWNMRDGRR